MNAADWTVLCSLAPTQAAHFTTVQAAEAGHSRPLLALHVKCGRALRVRRGVYRLRDSPSADYEDLVVAWLWSHQERVVSHETAWLLQASSEARNRAAGATRSMVPRRPATGWCMSRGQADASRLMLALHGPDRRPTGT